jgi:hypothetical protein
MLEEARLFLRCHLGSLDLAIDDLFHARQLVSVHTKGATRPAYGKNEPNLAGWLQAVLGLLVRDL